MTIPLLGENDDTKLHSSIATVVFGLALFLSNEATSLLPWTFCLTVLAMALLHDEVYVCCTNRLKQGQKVLYSYTLEAPYHK